MNLDYAEEARRFVETYVSEVVSSAEDFSRRFPNGTRYELFYDAVFLGVHLKTDLSYENIAKMSSPMHWLLFNPKAPYFNVAPNRDGITNIDFIKIPNPQDLVGKVVGDKKLWGLVLGRSRLVFNPD